ncbi:MAG: HAD-IIA family hydrolase [Actinomycetota bacterium]|nr:HAD-IIA family hydrolase [Actinomycetota bacterium]
MSATRPAVLAASDDLTADYDVALLDLDGVVYVGADPVPGAAAALTAVRARGMRLAYVTNNASRHPAEVAALLSGMGVPAAADEVVTSAQAAGHLLRDRLPPGSSVLIVGSAALADEVRAGGLVPVRTATPMPTAVVQGYSPDIGWRDLAEAAIAVRGGALWVATNTDSTLPSARGPLPGNGALVAAVRTATGAVPEVVGKPQPGLHRESVERTGARRPLVVGDRLDTDIEGAVAAGADSMIVLTGVTTADELIAAAGGQRPTYMAADVTGLLQQHPPVVWEQTRATCRGFAAALEGGALVLSGAGADPVDALRALCAVSWGAEPAVRAIRPSGEPAAVALRQLGIRTSRGA